MLPPGPSAPAWPGPPAAGGSAAGRKLQRRGREPVPALLPAGPPSSPRRAAAALSGSQSHFGEEGRGAGGEGGPQGRSSKVQLCAGVPAGSGAVAAGGALRAGPRFAQPPAHNRCFSLSAASTPQLWRNTHKQRRPKRRERSRFRGLKN